MICSHFEGYGFPVLLLRIDGLKRLQCGPPLPLALGRERVWLEKASKYLNTKYTFTCAVCRHPYLGQVPSWVILVPGRAVGSKFEVFEFTESHFGWSLKTWRWMQPQIDGDRLQQGKAIIKLHFCSLCSYQWGTMLWYYSSWPQNKSKTYKARSDMNTLYFH